MRPACKPDSYRVPLTAVSPAGGYRVLPAGVARAAWAYERDDPALISTPAAAAPGQGTVTGTPSSDRTRS